MTSCIISVCVIHSMKKCNRRHPRSSGCSVCQKKMQETYSDQVNLRKKFLADKFIYLYIGVKLSSSFADKKAAVFCCTQSTMITTPSQTKMCPSSQIFLLPTKNIVIRKKNHVFFYIFSKMLS